MSELSVQRSRDLTSFIGRDTELDQLGALLGSAHLVTITGPGGVGKTRLALRATRAAAEHFIDGAWLVPLAAERDPDRVARAFLDALTIAHADAEASFDILNAHLRGRDVLLLIDNCEHLADAVATVVERLLRANPGLTVVATSRQPLRVPGERIFPVAPLAAPSPGLIPAPGTAIGYAAVALFVERAAAAVPGFAIDAGNEAAIVGLCQQLDGIPLAIELAAARLRALSLTDLSARLGTRFSLLTGGQRTADARQQTLRAMVDWSYDLCTADERELWSRASVFVDSFDLDGIEAVCCDSPAAQATALEVVSGLVDKSIVLREEHGEAVRFRMLETIRHYGETVLADLPTRRRRHAHWYAGVLATAGEQWLSPRQPYWSARLRGEYANIIAAFDWCVSAGVGSNAVADGECAARLASPYFLWMACGSLAEGAERLAAALRHYTNPDRLRAGALWSAAFIACTRGHPDTANGYGAECKAIGVATADALAVAMGEHQLGFARALGGDPTGGARHMEDALAGYLALGADAHLEINIRLEIALAYLLVNDTDRSDEQYQRAQQSSERVGESWLLSYALWGRSLASFLGGDLTTAAGYLGAALEIKREFRDALGLALVFEEAAWICARRRDRRPAAYLLGAAEAQWVSFSARPLLGNPDFAGLHDAAEAAGKEALGTQFGQLVRAGQVMAIDESIGLAIAAISGQEPENENQDEGETTIIFTRREREVVELIAMGMTNKEIAHRLVVSPRTAESHVQNILAKLGLRSRAQVAAYMAGLR